MNLCEKRFPSESPYSSQLSDVSLWDHSWVIIRNQAIFLKGEQDRTLLGEVFFSPFLSFFNPRNVLWFLNSFERQEHSA